jgi:hypothetical protein
MELYLAGRATWEYKGERIPIHEVAIDACDRWLRAHISGLNVDRAGFFEEIMTRQNVREADPKCSHETPRLQVSARACVSALSTGGAKSRRSRASPIRGARVVLYWMADYTGWPKPSASGADPLAKLCQIALVISAGLTQFATQFGFAGSATSP